jgi:hypothetical protein
MGHESIGRDKSERATDVHPDPPEADLSNIGKSTNSVHIEESKGACTRIDSQMQFVFVDEDDEDAFMLRGGMDPFVNVPDELKNYPMFAQRDTIGTCWKRIKYGLCGYE